MVRQFKLSPKIRDQVKNNASKSEVIVVSHLNTIHILTLKIFTILKLS